MMKFDILAPSILQESIVKTVNPDNSSGYLIWHVQLVEGTTKPEGDTLLRAHARVIGREVALSDKTVQYYVERESQFDFGSNAIELAVPSASTAAARLAPRCDVIMWPRGSGIGRVLMSMLIRRARERFADKAIAGAMLSRVDAETDKERDVRNNFYVGHNFDLQFANDPECRDGRVSARRIDQLVEMINPDKVTLIPLDDLFIEYVEERQEHINVMRQVDSLQSTLNVTSEFWAKRILVERRMWVLISTLLFTWGLIEHGLS